MTTDRDRSAPATPTVVVTGLGLMTGLGAGAGPTWRALMASRSAARWLDLPGEPPTAGCPAAHIDHRSREIYLRAATDAVRDARIRPDDPIDRLRIGSVLGFSKGDILGLQSVHEKVRAGEEGLAVWTDYWPSGPSSSLSRVWDLRGPCLAPVAACATGVIAVLQGVELIRRGVCDVVVAGSADASLDPFLLGAFRRMRVLACVDGDPAAAIRPWDRRRSGFLIGEGGAVLVLEREDHARARGILPYAELAGGAFGADAYHVTDLNPDPSNLASLIGRALRDADVDASEIDYVNVHGTATRANDPLECRAIRTALGTHADSVSCSANKAQIGHLLGGAGAAELAVTCLAIRDGFVPPTINLDEPDPACDLDATPHVGRPRTIRAALKLSIGFGGHLAAAVLRQPEGPRRVPVSGEAPSDAL